MNTDLQKIIKQGSRAHFVGIGGIGVSYLAHYFIDLGWEVTGSTLEEEPILETLRARGARIFVGKHQARHLSASTDLVIAGSAVAGDNPELVRAHQKSITIMRHSEVVGELTKSYYTIAIAGTHGKSTITALLGLMLKRAKFKPTVFVGAQVKEFQNRNYLAGSPVIWRGRKTRFLIVEADEYQKHFLNYQPDIIVLTKIDYEHPDVFSSFQKMQEAYRQFIKKLPSKGGLVIQRQSSIKGIIPSELKNKAIFCLPGEKTYAKIKSEMRLVGEHNALNMLTAYKTAKLLGADKKACFSVVRSFRGVARRFELSDCCIGLRRKETCFELVNDYAHHPTEIKATLKAARTHRPESRLVAVFQPHQSLRLTRFFNDFVSALYAADVVILTPVYEPHGRQTFTHNKKPKTSHDLRRALEKKGVITKLANDLNKAAVLIEKIIADKDILVIMGAGSINLLAQALVKRYKVQRNDSDT